jgi:hypothetical protein
MSTIGGPGGVGGPSGPQGPSGSAPIDEAADVREVAGDATVEQARGAAASEVDRLAAEVAAGRLTQHEAIDRLVEAAAGPGLDASERAELRELLTDLVANDPYLGGLIGRI